MRIKIYPSKINGIIKAPPSKSYAHRALICSALSGDKVTVNGISESSDMKATLGILEAMDTDFSKEKNQVIISGNETFKLLFSEGDIQSKIRYYDAIESGSTLRFMIPVVLLLGGTAIFTGSQRLIERGIGVYEDVLPQNGIRIEQVEDGIKLEGKLRSGDYVIPGDISSQFASGLLMALPLLDSDSTLKIIPPIESKPYIDITLEVMRTFGVIINEISDGYYKISGNQRYQGNNYNVEGDWSNAAALMAYNLCSNDLTVEGLNENSLQGDRVFKDFSLQIKSGENDGDNVFDISDCPDLGPVLFSCLALNGGGKVSGIRRLRIKESDRVKASLDELAKFGVKASSSENELIIYNSEINKPDEIISSHNDHRIVMAMMLLLSKTGGIIENAEAINKSYPNYFDELEKAGLKFEYEN